jgi:anaerobic magnesium-protoporphyrin IX monomethyl ester cyclase
MSGKVVLFFPNPFSSNRQYTGAPLGLLAISRILDSEGYKIKIIHPITHKDYATAVVDESKDAICVGISSMTGSQITDGLMVAKRIRSENPSIPIVWGGWHPSILPRETLESEYVDIVVKGQGERTFTELVHCIETRGDLRTVAGIAYKENGAIVDTQERKIECLDNFPPLPYHLIDAPRFMANEEYGDRCILYFSSYGCPHRCGFCVEEIVNKRRWVSLSAERVVDDLERLKKAYGIDSVAIIDTNFFVNKERVKKICQLMIERGINIRWGNVNGRTSTLVKYDDNLWELMKQSGLSNILIGAESGEQSTLDFMQKDIDVNDTVEIARICKRHEVRILASYLAGFPWGGGVKSCERKVDAEIRITLKQIRKILRINTNIRPMFALYLPYPSTTLFSQSKQLGIDLPATLAGWSDFLIVGDNAVNTRKVQRWIKPRQAQLLHMLNTYIFFFLDPTSWRVYGQRIKNPVIRAIGFIGFHLFKAVVLIRWHTNFFAITFDFKVYSILRQHSNIS